MRRSDGVVLRDHGLVRTCSYEWMRCCDGGVPRPDGVVRAGARKYFSDWKLKLYVSFPVLLSTGANTSQLKYNHWEKSGKLTKLFAETF